MSTFTRYGTPHAGHMTTISQVKVTVRSTNVQHQDPVLESACVLMTSELGSSYAGGGSLGGAVVRSATIGFPSGLLRIPIKVWLCVTWPHFSESGNCSVVTWYVLSGRWLACSSRYGHTIKAPSRGGAVSCPCSRGRYCSRYPEDPDVPDVDIGRGNNWATSSIGGAEGTDGIAPGCNDDVNMPPLTSSYLWSGSGCFVLFWDFNGVSTSSPRLLCPTEYFFDDSLILPAYDYFY